MKRVLTGSFLAAAFAVGLSAQTTTPPQTTPPTTPPTTPQSQAPMQESRDRDAAKTVTVTGCLKAGDTADSFTLSDLKWDNKGTGAGAAAGTGAGSTGAGSTGAVGTGAVGTSGTATPPAAIASATTLKIVSTDSTKLTEHVGHQVEVTGSVNDKSSSSSSTSSTTSTTTPADPASQRAPSASASGPTIEARTVRMVSATCSGQ